MENQFTDLPDECWELIFSRLDHHSHFEAPSLVCKQFLSLTDRLRHRLTIVDPTIFVHVTLSKLFRRFQHLKAIDLSQFNGHLDSIVLEVARSELSDLETLDISNQVTIPLEGLKELGLRKKNLKALRCAGLCMLRDRDLLTIASSLPSLEELDVSYPRNNLTSFEASVTDSGIEALWSNLTNLRKLNISGNHFITDRSLVSLSLNCLFLREIEVCDCSFITENGIHVVLQNSPDMSGISVGRIQITSSSLCVNPLKLGRALSTLDFCVSAIPDEYLFAIAKAGIPLKRLSLSSSTHFTFSGISSLLLAYQSLEYLALVDVYFLSDQMMTDLCQYLSNLTSIKLNLCTKLTSLTFFTLTKNCPLLQDIEMETTRIGQENCSMEFVKNLRIKSLKLPRSMHLSDECLKKIASTTPNLELLDVRSCPGITGSGIAEILKSCVHIKHLQINDCSGIKELGTCIGLHKLEVLDAARSGLSDEALVTIGKIFLGLLKLELEGCERVETRGVEEVVRNCERLSELNLKGCRNVNALICDWIVFARPSLKKIIPPSFKVTTENQRKLLLRHGCLLCEK